MERLTYKVHDGGIFVKESDVKTFDVEDEIMHTGNAIRKLAEYENLEEQGLLLKTPCSIGRDVYSIPSKVNFELNKLNGHEESNRVYHQKVAKIVFTEHGWYLECDKDLEYGTGHILLDKFYKETWFLAQSEAEETLKRMEREESVWID